MDKLTSKKALLNSISLSEGTEFEYDERAILEIYKNQEENKNSLAIKILSIFGGFIGTLYFIGFLILTGLFGSEIGLLITGIIFIISAIGLNKISDKIIMDTFSISLYIIGCILFGFGLIELKIDENIVAILISVIAVISLIITQNFILSFISVLIISGSFIFLISNNNLDLIHLYISLYTLILTYIFLNEAKIITSNKKLAQLYNPIRIGVIMSLLSGLVIISKSSLSFYTYKNYIWILSTIIFIVVIMYLVHTIMKINQIHEVKSKIIIYILSSLILIPTTILVPFISGAIIVMLLSFLVNYKTGLAIGIISIIYFISQYYYDLNLTLLTKSIILMTSGIVFLLLYLFTTKNFSTNEKI